MDYLQDRFSQVLIMSILKASQCEISRWHTPTPLRYVNHHIQPEAAGGKTVPENIAALCDSCHYSVHRVMWSMARGTLTIPKAHRNQVKLAKQGYEACLAAGTVDKIPNQG